MSQERIEKDCYCHTCKKGFNHLGIARHRSVHRDKGENCKITYSTGDTYVHDYSSHPPLEPEK
jgi:hypothetical protein